VTHRAIRQAKLLFLLVLALTQNGRAADKLAVVIDVSGSMKNYGPWQTDAKDAIAAILAGQPLPSRWSMDPAGADLSSFSCTNQERLTLLRFGSVRPDAVYPYFTGIHTSLTPADLEAQFPTNPESYTESRTNKALAESVAIQSVADSTGTAQVIMLSDFYSDASLSNQQIAFINNTEDKATKYTLATLSWTGNPRVQIKLLRFVLRDAPARKNTTAIGSLYLSPPHYEKNSQTVLFAWNYEGPAQPEKYDVTVTDPRHGATLFRKYGLSERSVVYPRAAPGPLRWVVTAYMPNGGSLEQSAPFTVPDDTKSPLAVLFLFAVIFAAIGVLVVALKKYGPPDLLAKLKRRQDTDI